MEYWINCLFLPTIFYFVTAQRQFTAVCVPVNIAAKTKKKTSADKTRHTSFCDTSEEGGSSAETCQEAKIMGKKTLVLKKRNNEISQNEVIMNIINLDFLFIIVSSQTHECTLVACRGSGSVFVSCGNSTSISCFPYKLFLRFIQTDSDR